MTDLRTPPSRTLPPDFAEEDEVDLGRYWRPIAARWWLLLAGVVVGAVLGYLVSLSSGSVWQAKSTLYLGNPLSVGGSSVVTGLAQNPRTVGELIHSESAILAAAARCGVHPGDFRNGISTKTVSGGKAAAKTAGTSLVEIQVQAGGPRKAACPANVLTQRVVNTISPYVKKKVTTYETRLKTQTEAIASLTTVIRTQTAAIKNAAGLSALDQLVLINQLNNSVQQKAQLVDEQSDTQQLLALAKDVESPKIVAAAAARKTTARSPRNAMLVGAIIGLLVGLILALVWDRLPTGALRRNG
jgi:uncharacterized protein involved in exopolysaccharide biosynthesis